MTAKARATLEDLYQVPDHQKAELVRGEIVLMPPTGAAPGYAADAVLYQLHGYVRLSKFGRAVGDNKGFRADLPYRGSFSPCVAFYTGPPGGMEFYPEPPVFAVEVRSEGDYGPKAERAMAEKRADYFAAGTRVVWDVDLLSADVVRVYRDTAPDRPTLYRRGEIAEADPAVPGWTMPVDDLFE